MATIKKYDSDGNEKGEVDFAPKWLGKEVSSQSLKDYVSAIRRNKRQWSACTRGRSEVNHSKKKPHPQKKLGRARQGSLAAPQYKGGGVVFGPQPKFDQHVRINQKERKAVVQSLISEKVSLEKTCLIDDKQWQKPQTRKLAKFLKAIGANKRVLLVDAAAYQELDHEGQKLKVSVKKNRQEDFLSLSCRNLPKVEYRLATNLNAYDLLLANHIVFTESAVKELMEN